MTKKEFKKIRAQLLLLDITFAQIGRDFRVSREMVRQAVKGERTSDKALEIKKYVEGLL